MAGLLGLGVNVVHVVVDDVPPLAGDDVDVDDDDVDDVLGCVTMGVKRCSTAGDLTEDDVSFGITDEDEEVEVEEEDEQDEGDEDGIDDGAGRRTGLGAGSRGLLGLGGFCGDADGSDPAATLLLLTATLVDSGGGGIGTLPVNGATSMASSGWGVAALAGCSLPPFLL